MVCTPKPPSDCEEKENNGFAGFYSDEIYIEANPENVLNQKSKVISDTKTLNEVKTFASDQKQANILEGFLDLLSESGNGINQSNCVSFEYDRNYNIKHYNITVILHN